MTKKIYTIKDIAALAGVSKGTVDRVLHNRGRVSQTASQKVEAVLKRIEYSPNPMARNLKNNKVYTICVLLPDPLIDPYWVPAQEGVSLASKEYGAFNVLVEIYFYHPYRKDSFVAESERALRSGPDGLLVAPLFQEESLKVFRTCRDQGITLAYFNNTLDSFHNANFIGQDLFQSGKVAASLLDKLVSQEDSVGIIHINKEPHMVQKEAGFNHYFEEGNRIKPRIFTYDFRTDGRADFTGQFENFLKDHQEVAALFVTNSKAHLLVGHLVREHVNPYVVGYDLLEENIRYVLTGHIEFLIHQKPHRQAYLGVGQLAEHFIFGKIIPARNLLPIDILTSENIHYYRN